MKNKLYRSNQYKVIAGVCGGLAEYFSIDVTIVRLIVVLATLFGGSGILAYIIAIIIMPKNPDEFGQSDFESPDTDSHFNNNDGFNFEKSKTYHPDSQKTRMIFGGIVIFLGLSLLFRQFFFWFDLKIFFALVLVGIGAFIIFKERRRF